MARGSVIKKGNRYYGVFYIGPKQVWKALNTSNEKDAHKSFREIMGQVDRGLYRQTKPINFNNFADRYLTEYAEMQVKRGDMKESTLDSYRSILGIHLRPFFGPLKLTAIGPQVVHHFARQKAEELGGGKMTSKTYNNILTLLRSMFTWGALPKVGYLGRNPATDEDRARVVKHEMDFLTPDEIRLLIENARSPYDTLFHLTIFSGLRRGELLALKWGDVDWNRSKIRVRRSLYKGRFVSPKTEHSIREVDVSQRTLDLLNIHKAMYPPMESDLIFRTVQDKPLDPDNMVKREFHPSLERAGVRRIRFHDLRHTYATLLIDQGENIKYISKQLGHASVTITLDRYGHLLPDVGKEAMRRLDEAVFGAKTSNELLTKHP